MYIDSALKQSENLDKIVYILCTGLFDKHDKDLKFYKKFILRHAEWSSTETSLEPGQKKRDFDKDPVLDRMEIQLKKSGIQTEFVKNIDLNWAISDISRLKKQYANNDYILLFPFCSKKLPKKKWPFFKDLILRLKEDYKNKYPILLAPGPDEIDEANESVSYTHLTLPTSDLV